MSRDARLRRSEARTSLRQPSVVVASVILASLLFGLLILPRIRPRDSRVGTIAPEFSLPIVAGGNQDDRISLAAQRGKVVVLDFWATWCGPCAEQARILERFASVDRLDVLVLGVNEGESAELLRSFFAKRRVFYPNVSDVDERVGRAFSVGSLPTLAVIDQRGEIFAVLSGLVPYARLERLVADAANGR